MRTWVAALALVAWGCERSTTPAVIPTPPLRIAAASDLQSALPVVVERFQKEHPTEDVTLTFGASGQLAEQIRAGAPFDLFLSANRTYVEHLARDGVLQSESVRAYARGTLVLAVNRASGDSIQRLADLAGPRVKRVALANPGFAPYGAAGKQALEQVGLWDSLVPKVVQAESVRQALQFVQSGNAEAGLVGRAIANVPQVRLIEIDPKLYQPITQSLGIVAGNRRTDRAQAFIQYLTGDEGQKILAEFGFERPEGPP
jgi:molybdate transport system substrate-binding protein